MAGTADFKAINKKIKNSRAVQDFVKKEVTKQFESVKSETLSEFESHPVSIEISAGSDAKNTSGTLGGYGNLFTFIGFNKGESPISFVKSLLRASIRINKISPGKGSRSDFELTISVPEMEDLERLSPSPWDTKSWLRGIERGMSGFGSYMNKKFNIGRSGDGLQIDGKIRSGSFRNTSYLSGILKRFNKNVRDSFK